MMETYAVNVCQRTKGSVWQSRTRTSGIAPLLCINSVLPQHCHCKYPQCSRIIHAVIDGRGNRVITGDRFGYVYVFDLHLNKFWLLCKLGTCCSALAFTPLKERDVLIGTSDCRLHVFESAGGNRVASLTGHDSCISRICVDGDGRRALSCSPTTALLWDLLTLSVLQKLEKPFNSTLIDAFFVASGEVIITAMNGEKIGMWDSTTLNHVLNYTIPSHGSNMAIRSIAASADGKYLAASARTNWIILWEVSVPEKPKVMTVLRHIKSIRQLVFLWVEQPNLFGYSYILLVLNHNGFLHLYCVETGENVLDITLDDDRILSVHPAEKNAMFVACTCSGKVLVYDFAKIYLVKSRRHLNVPVRTTERIEDDSDLSRDYNQLCDVTLEHLRGIVKEFGAFPEKYRFLIWRNLLSVPGNDVAYERLASKGIHPVYIDIVKKYPIANMTVLRALQRVLSMLGHWCQNLTEVEYFPTLVFPFVKLFHTNLQHCLEIIIMFLCSWGQNWFIYFPNVPYNVLAAVENILAAHASSLLLHFVRHEVTAQIYAWPLLQSLFSEVVSRDDWLQLIDHIFSNVPAFLLYVVAAFNIVLQRDLRRCVTPSDFEAFFRHQHTSLSVREVIKTAYRLQSSSNVSLRKSVTQAIGMAVKVKPGSSYPVLNGFPKLAINWHEENKRLREEIEYFKKRQEILVGDTKVDSKKPCTCDGKRNDLPHLRLTRDGIRKAEAVENLFSEKKHSSANKQSAAKSPLFEDQLSSIRPTTNASSLQGKNVFNEQHLNVVKDVLRTRKMICEDTDRLNSGARWSYEML